jgi:hypothetical protein
MTWPEAPCDHCPRQAAGLPAPCPWQVAWHRRGCELVDPAHPDYDPAYLPYTLGQVAPSAKPAAVPAPNLHLERLELVHGCDYRGARLGEGCACLAVCLAGKGRKSYAGDYHEVATADCLACVTA